MASSAQQQQAAAGSPPSAQVVGNAFVQQYYHILHQSPQLVYRFYQDISKLGRPENNGIMGLVSTMDAINEKILSLEYGECTAEIKTVDAQDSYEGGVLVLVTGYLTGKNNVKQNFTQTFFLAPQDKGYFVLNDMFRYVDDVNHHGGNQGMVSEVEAPLTPDQGNVSAVQENHVSNQMIASGKETNVEEAYNSPENGEVLAVEEEAPAAEVVDEIHDDSQLVTESNFKIEEVPKKSYASIVKVMKESGTPLSTNTPPRSALLKSQDQEVITQPALASEVAVVSSNAIENANSQDGEADGYSIYVRGLPMSATPVLLEQEFKRFGPIKMNGIQVRSNKGFCFGFVEFEMASAVQNAIEASPIIISGRQVFVEEKRSSRGSNRGRFTSGRGGGFRIEGVRGRGNYGGGRGYNRVDFNNRAEFGNKSNGRGGYSNRGGDGYQRPDHVGSNGGRTNRAGGMVVSATAKNVAPRVSAPA